MQFITSEMELFKEITCQFEKFSLQFHKTRQARDQFLSIAGVTAYSFTNSLQKFARSGLFNLHNGTLSSSNGNGVAKLGSFWRRSNREYTELSFAAKTRISRTPFESRLVLHICKVLV